MKNSYLLSLLILLAVISSTESFSQVDTGYSWKSAKKNIVRYNVSSALLFGVDKVVILGYERLVKPNQSFSINAGKTAFPKLKVLESDSIQVRKDLKNTGFNASFDYRFYLQSVNKYNAPRGVYIGPYYSFNQWKRENEFSIKEGSANQKLASSEVDFNLHMAGIELGYQFVFWKRAVLDLVLIGPGVGFYNIKAKVNGNLTDEERENVKEVLVQVLEQRFPGMNYVLSDKQLDGSGTIRTSSLGFRYLVHIGFLF